MPWTPANGQQRRSWDVLLADVTIFCTHPFAHNLALEHTNPLLGTAITRFNRRRYVQLIDMVKCQIQSIQLEMSE